MNDLTGFGSQGVSGEDFAESTIVVDDEGLHLRNNAVITLDDGQGGTATIDASQTHKDFPLYGLANADFGDGPPDPSMNLMVGVGPYERTVRNLSPVAYWRLGETSGTSALELMQSRNGTYTGGFTLSADGALVTGEFPGGLRDKAVTLNGTTGYVTVTTATALHPGDTFSINAWIKKAADGTIMTILSAGANDYEFGTNASNQLVLRKQGGSDSIVSSVTITGTAWHMVTVTKATTTNTLYIDGVADTGATTTNQTIVAAAVALNIGRRVTSADRFWNGSVDEVSLFSTELTATQVAALYQVGSNPFYDKALAGSNFMPNWRFVQSSNSNITARQVTDSASPSGSNLRFTFAAGLASDEAFVEQIVGIGGSRKNWQADLPYWVSFRSSGSASFQTKMYGQYLDVDGNSVGGEDVLTQTPSGTLAGATISSYGIDNLPAPTEAAYLRVRVGALRGAAVTTDTGAIDITEVRRIVGSIQYIVVDVTAPTKPPGTIGKSGGILGIVSDETSMGLDNNGIYLLPAGSSGVRIVAAGPSADPLLDMEEQAAPGTPSSGFVRQYGATDGNLHAVNDAGRDIPLFAATGTLSYADTDVTTSGALSTVKSYSVSPSGVTAQVMPFPGSVIGIGVRLATADARTAGAITFQARNQTASTDVGPTCVLNASNTLQDHGTAVFGTADFAAGDRLGVRSTVTTATYAPITGDLSIFLLVAYTIT